MTRKTRPRRPARTRSTREGSNASAGTARGAPAFGLTRFDLAVCLVLAVAIFAVFGRLAGYGYINFDDPLYVSENPVVRAGLTWAGIEWAFAETHLGFWIPVTWLSFMLECQLFGPSPGAQHVTNVVLHLANTLLVFLILRRVTGFGWRAAFVAGLFAIHPLRVESVAWITERKDVLSTLFWLLAIAGWLRYVASPSVGRYVAVAVSAALGLMSKPMVVMLPVSLLLLDYWPLGRMKSDAERGWASRVRALVPLVVEKVPLFALSGAAATVTLLAHESEGVTRHVAALSIWERLATAAVSYATYLGSALWPHDLGIFYPYDRAIPGWWVAASVVLLAGVTALAIWQWRRRYLLWGWLWYLLLLVPVIGLVQAGSQARADRFTYVPLLGIFVAAVWGVAEATAGWARQHALVATVAGLVFALLCVVSWQQVGTWRDSLTVFQNAVAVTERNHVARTNLGLALAERGRVDEAITQYREALRIAPDDLRARTNLGNALARRGELAEAVEAYEQALRIAPNDARAHSNLGVTLARLGRTAEARDHYERALASDPKHVEAYTNLGNLLYGEGRTDAAIEVYSAALRIDPAFVTARFNLAEVLASVGRNEEALAEYERVLAREPSDRAARERAAALRARLTNRP